MANISTLQQSLINAKRVMGKVESGDFTTGNQPLPQVTSHIPNISEQSLPQAQLLPQMPQADDAARQDLSPKKNMTEDRIRNSRLPDAIKQAMIDNPIPEIPFNGGLTLNDDFVAGVKEQMHKQNMPTSTTLSETLSQQTIPTTSTKTKKITSSNLKSIIKESVKELLDETIGLKKKSNENFQFRVGDRIFYGKITSSKSVK
tara:strand:- start:1458 stop:2063 length:606 start_codon:yes stop_codon:yes gene_type:complete